jgi:hypothetical protein
MGSGLFSKASGETSESLWELSVFQRLIEIVGRNWLLRSGNQIEVVFLIFVFGGSRANFVKLLIIVQKLTGL